MNQPALMPVTKEPPFLVNNWKRILGRADDHLAKVRVIGGVATVTDGKLILRSPTNTPDGFYRIGRGSSLEPHTATGRPYMSSASYPDIGIFEPPLSSMKPFGQMNREGIVALIAYCEKARSLDVWGLDLHRDGFSINNRNGNGIQDNFNYRFETTGVITLQPLNLKLALTEMLRYDFCNFFRESLGGNSPLILGHDWSNCAMVNTLRGQF